MEWWQTLLIAAIPVLFTAAGLVSQTYIQTRAAQATAAAASRDAEGSRAHELTLSARKHAQDRSMAEEDRMRSERAAAIDGLLLLYSAVKAGKDRAELIDAEYQARRGVSRVLANGAATGKTELSSLLTHLIVCAHVRSTIAEDAWASGEKAAFDVADTLLNKYLEKQTASANGAG